MNKYTRMNWENTPSTATPLTADNLNHMDEGIEQVTNGAIALETEVNQLKGNAEIDETNLETVKSEITAARGESETLGERLDNLLPDEVGVITTDHMRNGSVKTSKIANDAITTDKIIAKAITASKLSLELLTLINSVANKADTADVDTALATKADKATTLAGYGITDAYTKNAVDALLANKASLINSLNIFDFAVWAKGLQSLTNPVYRGTLDKVDYNEKSLTLTFTESGGYTTSWISTAPSMKIAVKPNTKYLFSWLPSSTNCGAYVFLNGVNTDTTRFKLKSGFGSFTTSEDTTYVLIRFDYYGVGFFKVSKIMITEKESIYLPIKIAEGVPEVADEILTFEKTTQASLDGKYDSSNIESGTSMLTPYSTVTDKIKSASCTYKTIGDIVIVSATVKMNAATIGANSTYPLIDLPYKCIAEDNVFCVGISNLGKVFKFAVLKNNTWLQFQTQDKTAYTFADGEQINVICSYKIK